MLDLHNNMMIEVTTLKMIRVELDNDHHFRSLLDLLEEPSAYKEDWE